MKTHAEIQIRMSEVLLPFFKHPYYDSINENDSSQATSLL